MVLCQDFDGKMVFQDIDVAMFLDLADKGVLNLGARVVGVMQDAELGVTALSVQVERAVLLAVEIHTPLHHLLNLGRSILHHQLHSLRVAEPVAGHHRVVDVFVEIIYFHIGDTRHTALSQAGVRFLERGFADEGHFACMCYL